MEQHTIENILGGIDEKYLSEAAQYAHEKNACQRRRLMRSAWKAAACLALTAGLSVTSLSVAAAQGVESAYNILYSVNPAVALKLRPVNVSCEDNGIKMEVEGVNIKDDAAEIYVSMQDLTGGRIDGTTDLFDSAELVTKYDSIGTCSLVDYNETEKKATFLVYQQLNNHKKIKGSKAKFNVSRFISHKREKESELSAINLTNLPSNPKTKTDVDIRGASDNPSDGEELSVRKFLEERKEQKFSPLDGVTITAYAFVDGNLHIQADYGDILKTDNHGLIWLQDKNGNRIDYSKSVSFWKDGESASYEEYIFDVSPEADLENLSVWGWFQAADMLTTGNWSVTFPMENQ